MFDIAFLLPPFTACVLMVLMFGYLGIHVLKREVIFIDIALAQIAAAGATFALVLLHVEEHTMAAYLTALGFTLLAALFFALSGQKIIQIPHEAIIGISYAIAAAAALFMLALAAGGDVHVEHMLTGSILWAEWHDILVCASVFLLVGTVHYVFRHRFIRLSESMNASNHHEKSLFWDFLFYATMGLVITIAVRIAGVLVIFSLLIIPATFSALFADTWRSRLWLAYVFGSAATVLGLVFSCLLDFSCGPSVVTFLGIGLILGAIVYRIRRVVKDNRMHSGLKQMGS